MNDFDPEDFDVDDYLELQRKLEQEVEDLPTSDREDLQRAPRLGYAVLYASDVEDLAEFYEAVFAFPRRYESGVMIELQAGPLTLAISDIGQLMETVGLETMPDMRQGRSSLTFLVEDVDQCYQAALDLGATSVKEPHDTDWGMRSCWLNDPAGHLLEIGRWRR